MKWNIFWNYFIHKNILDVYIHMIQDWLVVLPPSIFYTVYNVLFHKY